MILSRPHSTRTAGSLRWSLPVLVVLLVACLSACTGGGSKSPTSQSKPGAGTSASAQTSSTRGGELRVVAGQIDSLDPARSYQQSTWNLMRLYTRTLVTYSVPTSGGAPQLVPDLATTTGTVSPDGRTWSFTLKPGLAFDDGTPITSKDVKYGIERNFAVDVIAGGPSYLLNLLDDPEAPYAGPYSDSAQDKLGLKSVATPDEATIVFTLRRPYADFGNILAMPGAAPVPKARDPKAKYASAPASSGPYVVSSVDQVQGIKLVRNKYWTSSTDQVRTALPDTIVIRTGLSQLARDQDLLSGAADVDLSTAGVSPRTEMRIVGSPQLAARSVSVGSGRVRMLVLPTYKGSVLTATCKAALAATIDRTDLVKVLGGPMDAVATSVLWPPGVAGGPKEPGEVAPKVPDAATAQACWPAGSAKLNFSVANLPADLLVAKSITAALSKAGIATATEGSDPATFYAATAGDPKALQTGKISLVQIRWSADYPSASAFLPRLADSRPANNAGANFGGVADPAVDAALDAALAPTAKGSEPWRTVAKVVGTTHTYIPLVAEKMVLIGGQRLQNAVVNDAYHGYDLALVGVLK